MTPSSREARLEHWTAEEDRRAAEQIAGDRSPELLVLLAFSGGGTRAASFSYGVLQELAATEVLTENGPKPLHHEVDVISSVSGGSFTSAYFGLRGDGIFEEFEARFLRKNIEGALALQLLNPVNWFKLARGKYGRSDLAAEYYGKHIFDGATFADLARADAPAVIINSTDLGSGLRFSFQRQYFDLICADHDAYPLSRAVAASSAVPGLLSPISLESYAGTCGYETNPWLIEASKARETIQKVNADLLLDLLDREERPWLHLVDGGISDNLGLRAYWNRVAMAGSLEAAFPTLAGPGSHQVLLILVNSIEHPKPPPAWLRLGNGPSLLETLGMVSSIQIARYDLDTIELVRETFGHWAQQRSQAGADVTFDFVDVAFSEVRDDTQREFLEQVGTNFDLSDAQVDALIEAGREVLRESPEFQSFLEGNRRRHAAPTPSAPEGR